MMLFVSAFCLSAFQQAKHGIPHFVAFLTNQRALCLISLYDFVHNNIPSNFLYIRFCEIAIAEIIQICLQEFYLTNSTRSAVKCEIVGFSFELSIVLLLNFYRF